MRVKFDEALQSRLLRLYTVISLVMALLAPLAQTLPAQAATYRNFIAQQSTQPVPGQIVRVWVNSDTVLGETAGLEYNIGSNYIKVLGTFDTSYAGANWRIDIPASAQTKDTFVRYQLFTRNQSGEDYGFSGFNWSYTTTDIHWNGLKHDTFDSYYRSPFGAQPTGSTVTIRFRTEHYNVTSVVIKVYQLNPDHETSTNFELNIPFESTDNTYDYWRKDLTLPATPTIWYYKFKLLRGNDGINSGAGSLTDWYTDDYADDHDNLNQGGTGTPAHSEANQSFQLSIYDSNFQTPDWMQNAFVYQIFPDRFRNGDHNNDPDPVNNPRIFYGNIQATYHSTWNEQPEDGRVTGNYNRDFFGGDLQGIINKLDYLKSLGITAIYMTPIVKAESNHRYDTDNYEDVDPYLGDPALFQALVAQSQQRGIKLILDGVYNHTSSDSLYFDRYHRYSTDGACESTSSPFRSWYTFNNAILPCNDSSYNGWFGYPSLAVMDKSQAKVRDYIFGGSNNTLLPAGVTQNVTQFWYNLGAAGFRFDVADDATFHHNYWQAFRSKAKTYNSSGPLIGEIWPDASPWLLGDELDAVMNYRFRKDILGFARYPYDWVDNDNNGSNNLIPLKPSEFDRALKSIREDYPPAAQYAMMNLIDSHDTNRALYVLQFTSDPNLNAAKARLALVATFQFTYIGAPTVYYGDEAGLNAPGKVDSSGVVQDDPYNRAPFPWDDTLGYYGGQDHTLTNYYAKLAYIRNQHSALRTGDFRTLLTDDTNLVYSFGRSDASEKMVVALNNNSNPVSNLVIPVSGYIADGMILTDALTNTSYTVSAGKVTINSLAAKGAVILSTRNTPTQTALDTSFTQKPNATTNSVSATFSFSATISGSTFECSLDNAAFITCTSPVSFNVTNGSHTLQVRAIDPLGNVDPSPASYSWVVDTIPPVTSITANPALLTSSTSASFSFSSSEAGSTFQCKLEGGNFTSCNSPVTYTGLTEGNHTFQVKAIDPVGNTDPGPASYSWTVDATPPDTTLTTSTATLSNSASASFSLTSNENNSTFQCKVDNGPFAACISPFNINNLAEGSHTFAVKATDQAGNTDPTPASYNWTVDTTLPVTTLTAKPASVTNANSASFSFNATETATFQCSLDNANFTSCVSGITYNSLADGTHGFTVKATDAAGNVEANAQTYQWLVDTIAPVVTLDAKPASLSNSKSASFTFHASETVTGFQCILDSGSFGNCDSGQTYSNLADGSHTFKVKASDAADNTSVVVSYSWMVDTVSPLTVIDTNPEALTNLTSASFTFHSTKSGSIFGCSLDGSSFVNCSSPASYSNLAEGSHTFKVRATDPAGNTDPNPAAYSWTVDTTAPTVSFTDNPPALSNIQPASFSFQADEANTTFACSLDGANFAACSSPAKYTGLADGNHNLSVKATDAAGNTGAPKIYSWTVDTVAPAVSLTGKPGSVVNSKNASFSFTANENGSTFQCSLDNDTFGPCTSGQSYTDLVDGAHNFSVKATDAAGNTGTAASYSWTVDTLAPAAVLDVTPGAISGRNANFSFHATEDGSKLECHLDSAAFAVCNGVATYSNLAGGSHTFEVRATDQAGNVGAVTVYTWTVDATPPVADFTGTPASLTNSATASFSFSANEASTFQCKLDSAGYTDCISPYVINNLTAGVHTFTIKATDNYGNTGTEKVYSWTLDTVAPTTTISAQPSAYTNASTASFSFTSSKSGSTFQCRLDGGPFVNCSSPTSYNNLGEGSHTFQVKALDAAGNLDPNPASYTWIIDTTPPTATITGQPNVFTNSNTANFSFQAGETGSTFECGLDGGAFAACTSPLTYSGLTDKVHSFSVRAIDAAGNVGTAQSYSWTVDTTSPVVIITGAIQGKKYILGSAPSPGCSASDSGVAIVCSGTLTGGNANGVGSFNYTATATDKAGNTTSVSVSYKVIYDFSGFLSPLNNGNNANNNVFKAGSTVPVKFQLKRADNTPVQALTAAWLTPVRAGTTSTSVPGNVYSDPATTGGSFTWSDNQYIYQWGTAKTNAGYHWRIGATLDDGETYYIIVDLR